MEKESLSRTIPAFLLAASGLLAAGPAHALQITSLTPQGEVARVRQIVAKFDQAAVNFGDPKAPAPLAVSCSDAQAGKGTGRWTGEKQWVYDFENDLPPGVRCTVTRGRRLQVGRRRRADRRRALPVQHRRPVRAQRAARATARIDEQQFFVLELNGAATLAERADNVWCAADGVGERMPVQAARRRRPRRAAQVARPRQGAPRKEPLRFVTLQLQPHAARRPPRCSWSTARAWPRPRASPTTSSAASTSRCASPSPCPSPASARTRRPPACRCGR